MQQILPFLVTGGIFLALDMAWFALSGQFYKAQLGAMMRDKIGLPAASIFYVLYVIVMTLLAVLPAAPTFDSRAAAVTGGLLGVAAYAAYNFTNMATLRGWPKLLSYVDMVWGTVASAATAWLSVTALAAL